MSAYSTQKCYFADEIAPCAVKSLSKMKKAAPKKAEIFEEEEILQAVVICGESSYSLLPLIDNFPSVS